MTEVLRKATGLDKLNGVAGIIDTILGKSVANRYYNQRNSITAATKSFAAEILNNGEYLAGCKKPAESTLVTILNDIHKYALNAAEQYEVGRDLLDDDYEPWTFDFVAAEDPNDSTKLVETNDVDRLHLITSMKAGTSFLKDLAGVTKSEEESINSSAEYEDRYLDQLENKLKEKLLSLGQSEVKHPDSVYVIKNKEVQDAITKANASAASDQRIVEKAERQKKKKRSSGRTDQERDEAVDNKKRQKQINEKQQREEDNSKANEGTESVASILKIISDNIPTKEQQQEHDRVKMQEKIASNEALGTAVGNAVGNAFGAAFSSMHLPFRVSPPSISTHESLFCKHCGSLCTSASKYCNQCGKEV